MKKTLTTKKEFLNCKLGLYRIFWNDDGKRDGGSSLASVGNHHDGVRWLAPINWTAKPSENPTGRMDKCCFWIKRMELVLASSDNG